MRKLFLPGLLAAVLLTAACDVQVGDNGVSVDIAEGKVTDEWVRSYTLPPGGRLEIVNVNGSIDASPATGPQIEVHARREVKAQSDEDAREFLRNLQMAEDVTPGHVKIEAGDSADRRSGRVGRRQQLSIDYRVQLPPGLVASFQTQNGSVRLENIDGTITAATTNGRISGEGLSGAVHAATVNGGVQIAMASLGGDLDIATVNGGVRLEVPSSVAAHLDASAVNGGISIDDALPFVASQRARLHVAGTFNGGGRTISVHTTNGEVRISARGARTSRTD